MTTGYHRLAIARSLTDDYIVSSLQEVFDLFERWKTAETLLRVTVQEYGQAGQELRGKIFATDRDARLVELMIGFRKFCRIDLTGAIFEIGKHMLEASRPGDELLVFEEIQEPKRDKWVGRHLN
jgi:hypothetical protein